MEQRREILKPKVVPITALRHRHLRCQRVLRSRLLDERSIMQKSYFLPDNVNLHIHRPACRKCHAHMMLARIMPARMGFDLHTFECPKCEHLHEVMVETDAFGMSSTPRQ